MTTASFAQTESVRINQHLSPDPFNTSLPTSHIKYKNVAKTTGGQIDMRVDPMFFLATSRGGTFGTGGNVSGFVDGISVDSLTKVVYSNGTSHIGTFMAGLVFDPKSISQSLDNSGAPTFNQLLSKYDAYTIDSVFLGGTYRRVSGPAVVDTLILDIVWGDTSNTNVFGRYSMAAPLEKFHHLVAPKYAVSTPTTVSGQILSLAAPATNRFTKKIPLNEADTMLINQTWGRYFPYKLPTALNIPANQVVAIGFTFKSGMAYNLGDVSFSFDPGTPAVVNGFLSRVYAQSPSPTSPANFGDFFLDFAPGKNQGWDLYADARYRTATGAFANTARPGLISGTAIDLTMHALSTVGVEELNAKGFSLSQNVPNPFSSQSTIQYELSKGSRNVTFSVYDVTGRVMVEMPADGGIGVHAINVGPFAAGVYYYTLNVDGNVITKKMVVQN